MTDLKEHIATVRRYLPMHGYSTSTAALDAIEAALFPEPGPAPDPTKQFVVGETYISDILSGPGLCVFVFDDGAMGYTRGGKAYVGVPFDRGAWRHIPHAVAIALEAAKAERDAAAARLAELDAQIKEMEGGA